MPHATSAILRPLAARFAATATPIRGPTNENQSSPCTSCTRRATCSAPCSKLEALLEPEHRASYREIHSDALMRGYLRAGATEIDPVRSEELPEAPPDERIPRLQRLLDALPAPHRYLTIQHSRGNSLAELARSCRASRQVVAAVLRDSHGWLKSELELWTGSRPMNDNKEDSVIDVSTIELPAPGIPCAEPGCTNLVSATPPRRPELAPYCAVHRRFYSREERSTAPAERLPIGAAPPPSSEERAIADQLASRPVETSTVVPMTPGLARALLERNAMNRRIAKERVEVYARDMLNGAWELNNQGIALGADGQLYDGQHRLLAVARARVTVPMLVVSGLPPQSRATIDQGRVRDVGDNLRMLDGIADGKRLVAWFNAIEVLISRRPKPLSHAMVQRQKARYESSVAWFIEHAPRARPFCRAAAVGALLYAHPVAPSEVETFTQRYVSGAELSVGSPILTLRDYMAEHARTNEASRSLSLRVLRCVLAEIRGERLEKLYAIEEGFEYFRKLHEAADTAAAA